MFWPRWAVGDDAASARAGEHDVARLVATRSVRSTCRSVRAVSSSPITLTLSERWLTNPDLAVVLAATATGSRPTGMEAVWVEPRPRYAEDLEAVSGVLTANDAAGSGDIA